MSQSLLEHRLLNAHRQVVNESGNAGVVLIPVGSLEQHGDHLPLGCDSIIVEAIALKAAELAAVDVLVTPTLWCGVSQHHLRFGATATIGAATLLTLTREVVLSIRTWAERVAVVNGHGGNREALARLGSDLDVPVTSYWDLDPEAMAMLEADEGSIGHAGQAETSLMMAINPVLVGTPDHAFEPIPTDRVRWVTDLGTSGVIGNPRQARPELGHQLVRSLATALGCWLDSVASRTNA